MTVEEALVALLAAVAGILLYIGLAQALGDDRGADGPDEAARRRAASSRSVFPASGDRTTDPPRRSPRVLSGDTDG